MLVADPNRTTLYHPERSSHPITGERPQSPHLSRQCLDRRIPNKQTLIEQVAAWEKDRNKNHTKANWQFTTADARIKLKRLYPAM
jgi:hypothetical protein